MPAQERGITTHDGAHMCASRAPRLQRPAAAAAAGAGAAVELSLPLLLFLLPPLLLPLLGPPVLACGKNLFRETGASRVRAIRYTEAWSTPARLVLALSLLLLPPHDVQGRVALTLRGGTGGGGTGCRGQDTTQGPVPTCNG